MWNLILKTSCSKITAFKYSVNFKAIFNNYLYVISINTFIYVSNVFWHNNYMNMLLLMYHHYYASIIKQYSVPLLVQKWKLSIYFSYIRFLALNISLLSIYTDACSLMNYSNLKYWPPLMQEIFHTKVICPT